MEKFIVLTESINYIEANLCESITRQEIAEHCHVSLSMLEKLFRYALHLSIKEYIIKRQMTQAAKDISRADMSITEIAFKYQFNSIEVFSRAFKRVWNVNPSEFFQNWKFTGLFPKINFEYKEGEDFYMARRKVDMSDAYEFLKNMKGSYVLCFDAQRFVLFNEVSYKAGDLAIVEIASRIDRSAADDMLLMRIGGDEFALLTGIYDYDEAKKLADEILAQNGTPIVFQDQELPLSLWCGITKIPEVLRYSEFFMDVHNTITSTKLMNPVD